VFLSFFEEQILSRNQGNHEFMGNWALGVIVKTVP
jgi:hypothetical protein